MRKFSEKGFSIVEIVVALGIFSVLISGVTFLAVGSYSGFVGGGNSREVERFASEAVDALNIIKQRTWTLIDSNDGGAAVKVLKVSGDWTIQSGTETRGLFTRDIRIATVHRDSNGVIVTSDGTDDPGAKKATITIRATGRTDYVTEAYLINWESYRMSQTDWGGSTGTNIWTSGATGYSTTSDMDLPTSSGYLMLASSTAE